VFALLMGLKTVSPEELAPLVQQKKVTVLDVNSRQSWTKQRVPGAHNIDSVDFKDGELPTDRTSALVFYCSGPLCRKAPIAARRAKKMGYDNVRVMSAGISGWLAGHLPTESGS
jgi:rhodanese-related sulfurtransferase